MNALGLISKRNSLETAYSSVNNKDIKEIKIIETFSNLNSLKLVKIFNSIYSSSKNLTSKYNYIKLFLEQDCKNNKNNKNNSPYFKDKKSSLEIGIKINIKNEEKNKYSKNYEATDTKNKNSNEKKIANKKMNKDKDIKNNKLNNDKSKICESYGQNHDLKIMRENPPKSPELFSHLYNIGLKKTFFKENDSFGIIQKDIIPNVFYNHFLFNESKYSVGNKHKYNKISITQRNKKKLVNIIYISPWDSVFNSF